MSARQVAVAAGVIMRPDGRFLLGQRAPGTFYPGYWEFPGGKVEQGETAAAALVRELHEELGIRVRALHPWITREHRYEHAHVRLHFFEVTEWEGDVNDHVHSALSWELPGRVEVAPMLPANGSVLKALQLPRFMAITHATEIGVDRQLAQLDAALAGGLRLIELREPGMAPDRFASFGREVVSRAHACRALVMVNGSEQAATALGADGIHLSAARLAGLSARPAFDWVGASCHTRAELQRAGELGLDYALLGAVQPTPTHPERAALGWQAFADMVAGLPLPVFALGGLARGDMDRARAHGAHGVAAIRGGWPQSL